MHKSNTNIFFLKEYLDQNTLNVFSYTDVTFLDVNKKWELDYRIDIAGKNPTLIM
jgi:hypothetical protein